MAEGTKQTAKERGLFCPRRPAEEGSAQQTGRALRHHESGKAERIAADDPGIAATEYFKGAKLPCSDAGFT